MDELLEIGSVIDLLSFISMGEMVAVDEQKCSTKARYYSRQNLPLKPHKWVYKRSVLSGVFGFCKRFDIYHAPNNTHAFSVTVYCCIIILV